MCVRLSQFSQLSFIQYMGLCVFSLPISLMMIVRMYFISYNHLQIGSMTHLPLFRVRSWKNGMRCTSFYIFIMIIYLYWNSPQVPALGPMTCVLFSGPNSSVPALGRISIRSVGRLMSGAASLWREVLWEYITIHQVTEWEITRSKYGS